MEEKSKFVSIQYLPTVGFTIYHHPAPNVISTILSVDSQKFETEDEAKIYCDMMGYIVTDTLDIGIRLDSSHILEYK